MTEVPRIIPEILAMSAARNPGSIAIESRQIALSYAELDDRSSRAAAALLHLGVKPGDRVCVCAGKCPEALAMLFGALRAGAVFVPLDCSAPPKRLVSIAANCSPRVIAGSGRKFRDLLAELGEAGPSAVIELPEGSRAASESRADRGRRLMTWDEVMTLAPLASPMERRPPDVAYILYTSGSTGVPKGVAITHENALAFTTWARRRFEVGPGDRVPSVAPFHFDLSTFDIYSTLEGGGTIVLVPEETAFFPASLAAYLEAKKVTITYLVPSVITGMLLHADLPSRDLSTLRTILFAGEVFPPRYLAMLMETLPRVRLFNLYGPTETNVCTFYEVRPDDRHRREPVPIGVPASDDMIFALDDEGRRILEPGREGELYAAGPTVAAGYWGDAARTEALFLERHPHAPSGQRVYRTGDRVSLDAEGRWLYHGRRDHMVKSRGYRIELGEIESALHAHPAVAEAIVIALPDEEIGSRIKACIVLKPGTALEPAEVRRHCSTRVPRYMVPEFVEFLGSLPRTSSGKVDRLKLAASGLTAPEVAR